ncbi:hypothetical protein EUX98_g4899 [Antrodiella citrinella]|uniref:F-box domain-containing protein n=1 Tax=Antrodiella citrinella TaxID=2447956 RepID=A0A4S4MTR2_9APHY|nr:hypothetical protein EUX98_g4899 [Antrodiella citrinella]
MTVLNDLPETLIETILLHAADRVAGARENYVLGHISRRWRHVALNCNDLWSLVVANNHTSSKDSLRTQLSRSGSAPLDLRLTQVNAEHSVLRRFLADDEDEHILMDRPGVINLILREIPRARSLDLSLWQDSYASYADLLSEPFPGLETLRLHLPGSNAFAAARETLRPIFRTLPALHTLKVEGFTSEFSLGLILPFHILTSLTIHVPHGSPMNDPGLTCETLLDALQWMQKLEHLDLSSHVLPLIIPDSARRIRTVVDRRSLKTLCLSGDVPQVNWLLSHLRLSPSINMDLALFDQLLVDPGDFNILGSLLSAVFYPASHRRQPRMTSLSHAACIYTPSEANLMPASTSLPAIYHLILSEDVGVVKSSFEHAGKVPSYVWSDWSDLEWTLQFARERGPTRDQRRTLQIRMLESLAESNTRPDEGFESIWSQLHLNEVHTLCLHGVPLYGDPHQETLQSIFIKFVSSMSSVQNTALRGWDAYWEGKLTAILRSRLRYSV